MLTRARRWFPPLLSILAVGLVGASLAWACTPQARLMVTPTSGNPGDSVTVQGRKFQPSDDVTIRWNSATGKFLGKATPDAAGAFSVEVTIPPAPADTYYIVATAATATDADNTRVQRAAPFRIGPEPAAGNGRKKSGEALTSGAEGAGRSTATHGGGGARGAGGSSDGGAASTGSPGLLGPDPIAGAAGSSVGGATPGTAGRAGGPFAVGPRAADASATGDLWSGFAPGKRASLVPRPTDPAASERAPGSQFPIGLGLLGLGIATLLGGFTVAEVRRRWAPANQP